MLLCHGFATPRIHGETMRWSVGVALAASQSLIERKEDCEAT